MDRLDDIVSRFLRVKLELGLFDRPYTDEENWERVIRCQAHRDLSHEIARESLVLLKNDGVLPLGKDLGSVALIGPSSAAQKIGGYSSTPQFPIPSLYEEMKAALGDGVTVRQCNGCAITYDKKQPRVVDGQPHLYSEGEEEIADEMEEALALASACDVVVFVGGDNTITSGEGRDRCELTLNGRQRELIEKLAALGKPRILVTENGKPLDLSRENEVCNAILMAFFGGESGAKAIAEALTGELNPAGRLPLSLPRSSTRIPCYYSMLPGGAQDFLEGPKNALFPFGFGLSYTKFAYSDLRIEQTAECRFTVCCSVKNIGDRDGDEVVQLYLDDVESSVVTPPMLLKGFRRIRLKAGEEKSVTFELNYDSFKLMDIRYDWTVEPGKFRVLVGAGSRDIRLEGELTV
jgi:beta-glucosidase